MQIRKPHIIIKTIAKICFLVRSHNKPKAQPQPQPTPAEWEKYGIFKENDSYLTTLEGGMYIYKSPQDIIDKYKNP